MLDGCPEVSVIPDEELMLILQLTGDSVRANEIFGELFRRYHARVASWCGRLVHDSSCGMDLAQEVFLKAWRHRHTFRGDSRICTWLYAISRNHCLNFIRRIEADPLARVEAFPSDLADRSSNIHASVENAQAFRFLWALLEKSLTDMEKRVMALHFGHGMTLDAITCSCGLTNPSGAKAYIVNARRKLRRVMAASRKVAVLPNAHAKVQSRAA